MPSLPLPSVTPSFAMITSHTSKSNKYREVVYHLDVTNRDVALSHEVLSPSHHSSPAPPPSLQHLLSTNCSPVPRSSMRAKLNLSKTASEQSIVIVQSRGRILQDQIDTKARAVEFLKSTTPPPTPRPRRLPTPELSDIDDDRPFCHCDSKKYCASACCRRALP